MVVMNLFLKQYRHYVSRTKFLCRRCYTVETTFTIHFNCVPVLVEIEVENCPEIENISGCQIEYVFQYNTERWGRGGWWGEIGHVF